MTPTKREQRVLAYVNRLRAELGLTPLTRLPNGRRYEYASCPIANALSAGRLRGEVEGDSIVVRDRYSWAIELYVAPPGYVYEWIGDFDGGKVPPPGGTVVIKDPYMLAGPAICAVVAVFLLYLLKAVF